MMSRLLRHKLGIRNLIPDEKGVVEFSRFLYAMNTEGDERQAITEDEAIYVVGHNLWRISFCYVLRRPPKSCSARPRLSRPQRPRRRTHQRRGGTHAPHTICMRQRSLRALDVLRSAGVDPKRPAWSRMTSTRRPVGEPKARPLRAISTQRWKAEGRHAQGLDAGRGLH